MSAVFRSMGLGMGDTPIPASDRIGGDPGAPDTAADQAGGALGMLAGLLRLLFGRFFPPWVVPPPGFRAFDVQNAIATPVALTTPASTVLSIRVPVGFVTYITGLSVVFSGGGFNQGSGDLVYSITVDGAPVKGYGQILTDLGTMQAGNVQPRPVAGIFATSQQLIEVKVLNVAQAGGGTFVVATLVGYHYGARYHRTGGRGY